MGLNYCLFYECAERVCASMRSCLWWVCEHRFACTCGGQTSTSNIISPTTTSDLFFKTRSLTGTQGSPSWLGWTRKAQRSTYAPSAEITTAPPHPAPSNMEKELDLLTFTRQVLYWQRHRSRHGHRLSALYPAPSLTRCQCDFGDIPDPLWAISTVERWRQQCKHHTHKDQSGSAHGAMHICTLLCPVLNSAHWIQAVFEARVVSEPTCFPSRWLKVWGRDVRKDSCAGTLNLKLCIIPVRDLGT